MFEKRLKNGKLAKGLVHGFCQKIDLFFMCGLLGNRATKDRFMIFWIEENDF